MRIDTRLGLALAVALPLQLLPWTQLTRHTAALQWGAFGILVVLAVGWALRRLHLPPLGVVLAQVATIGAVGLAGVWVLHGERQARRLLELPEQGIEFFRGSSAPLFPNPGATLLIVVGVAVVALVADWVGITWRRPAWSVATLVVLHLVVALGLTTFTLFSEFVLLAVGIGLVLLAASPWGGTDRPATRLASWGMAAVMTAAAIGLTWVSAQWVPAFEPRQTNEPLQMSDPSLDLKRNLVQGSDDVVIRYRTDSEGGTYLKLASLPALSAGGFALSDVRVATGRIPAPPGSPPGERRTTTVEVGEFQSEWLPVPYAPVSFEAPGDWGFALDTLDVMAMAGPDRGEATAGISYEVTSHEVRPDAEAIARAGSGGAPRAELTSHLPAELPPRIRDLAHEVTAAAPTAGAKAQALEAFLRSDRFTYSTAPTTGTGDGLATIDDFLFESQTGYCEQYAGAMAIMAREVGIPTRMAVGFVPGTQEGDAWAVTARDLHTWPELWLEGLGWVAFEPTPSRGESSGMGTPASPQPGSTAEPTGGETAEPTPEPATASPEPSPEPEPTAVPVPPVADAALGLLPWLLGGLVLALLVSTAVLAPRLLRARRRSQRLAGTGDPRADTLAAWEEVTEVVADVRLPWPDGSPRFVAERLVGSLGGGDERAAEALRSLAAASERALFDRSENFDLPGAWADEVAAITAALTAGARERTNAQPRRAARR
ncbi:MAG TPA: transglutaminase domain-containing protein [Propionibacterium sp.]|nr:transglutaminase domain-containing protein [Propionibacterium sp.]